jgi:hypothetical protein
MNIEEWLDYKITIIFLGSLLKGRKDRSCTSPNRDKELVTSSDLPGFLSFAAPPPS